MKRKFNAESYVSYKKQRSNKKFSRRRKTFRRRTGKGYRLKKAHKGKSLSGLTLKKKVVSKMEKYGIQLNYNKPGQIVTKLTATPSYSNSQVAIIGHTTCAHRQLMLALSYAIVKRMAIKMNLPFSAFDETIEGLVTGGQWYLRWQANDGSATTSTSLGASAPLTWYGLVGLLNTILLTVVSVGAELQDFLFVATTTNYSSYRISLQDAYVTMYVNSLLKIQNQSTPTSSSDDTVDEVDAVTLTGKTYVGYGNGTAMTRPRSDLLADIGMWGDQYQGLIIRDYSLQDQKISDIPRAEELFSVKKSGPVVFGPGQIQQSKLNSCFKGTLNKIYKKIQELIVSTNYTKSTTMGRFAIHCMKKAIEDTAAEGDEVTPITLQYQIENTIKALVVSGDSVVTTQAVYINDSKQQ